MVLNNKETSSAVMIYIASSHDISYTISTIRDHIRAVLFNRSNGIEVSLKIEHVPALKRINKELTLELSRIHDYRDFLISIVEFSSIRIDSTFAEYPQKTLISEASVNV